MTPLCWWIGKCFYSGILSCRPNGGAALHINLTCLNKMLCMLVELTCSWIFVEQITVVVIYWHPLHHDQVLSLNSHKKYVYTTLMCWAHLPMSHSSTIGAAWMGYYALGRQSSRIHEVIHIRSDASCVEGKHMPSPSIKACIMMHQVFVIAK